MNKRQQQELIEWAEAAVKELEKYSDQDRGTRVLKDGGKALLKEIKTGKECKLS
jgi:hypothetical protein